VSLEENQQAELAARKAVELRSKLESLTREFKDWLDQSEAAKPGEAATPLEKHHTQIRRVTRQLEGLQIEITTRLDAAENVKAANAASLLVEYFLLGRMILEVHRFWEFFRAKFMMRRVDWFKPYLAAADELAWECYRVAQEAWTRPAGVAEGTNREPPLTFFNGSISPFIQPRNRTFQPEEVPNEILSSLAVIELLKKLPVPVIGIPWTQIRHLPDLLFLGHEVGHSLEDDFGLTGTIANLLNAAPIADERRSVWHKWSGEIFADIYGTLATGPAFVGALIDFLATDPNAVAAQQAGLDSVYPTVYLRVLLAIEALKHQGHTEESQRRLANWKAIYPKHAMPDYDKDVEHVVKALIGGPYPELGGRALSTILSFSPDNHAAAVTDAGLLLDGFNPLKRDVRLVFAAARLAFESDPARYAPPPKPGSEPKMGVHEQVIQWVLKNQQVGVRSNTRRAQPELMQELDDLDRGAGADLFEQLNRSVQASTPSTPST